MISLPIKDMTKAEKLMALEALWNDLSCNEEEFESPGWQQDELAATEERVKAGKEQFIDWEQAKKDFRGRFE
jgi:hypothetical protein